MPKCFKCNKELTLSVGTNISRSEECPACYTDLHCCKMCEFYDPKHYNECKESLAERVVEKEKANYCDYFKLTSGNTGNNLKQSALDAANALFKK